jgi:putative transcriptional regulator
MKIKKINIASVVEAIEIDAGETLPDLAQALMEARKGIVGRLTTSEQILVRQAREHSGLSQAAFAKKIIGLTQKNKI